MRWSNGRADAPGRGQAAGLTVLADGQRLVIRGPKSGEEIARRLLEHKADVLEAITKDPLAGTIFEGKWIEKLNHEGGRILGTSWVNILKILNHLIHVQSAIA